MSKALIIALLTTSLLTISNYSYAQCPTNLSFNSQTNIDSFAAWFPNCQNVTGDVSIASIVDGNVTNLLGLSQLQSIEGRLSIWPEAGLTSLDGLHNISEVGSLSLGSSAFSTEESALKNLSGLEGLTTIHEYLTISRDSSLTSLIGLDNLTFVGKGVRIENSPQLETLKGLDKLSTIGGVGNLELRSLDALNNIEALNQVTSINGTLGISNCASLTSLSQFSGLSAVGRSVSLNGLNNLNTINSFNTLKTIGGDLAIADCNSLSNLGGFNSLQAVGQSVSIQRNDMLEEITALDNIKDISGGIYIQGNDLLIELPGANALGNVGQGFKIESNSKLKAITGFNNLATVTGNFEIEQNHFLSSIVGFTNLVSVGGNFRLVGHQLLDDCSVFCNLLSEGSIGGTITIFSNAQNCGSETIITEACNSSLRDIKMFDANLQLDNNPPDNNDIATLGPEDLLLMENMRVAVAADGVSKILLIFDFKAAGDFSISWDDGLMETPWGTSTYDDGNSNYGFALFTPPETFGAEDGNNTQINGIDMREIQYTISISIDEEQETFAQSIPVVRPPVVLVHGTFSDPVTAWKTPSEGGVALFDILTNEGFKVFAVDYKSTNGSSDPSGFDENKMVVWKNKDGIKDALTYYRDTENIAVTQVDVVGHSLGGALPRVYASEHYNPGGYKRSDNFMEGDINRFITVAGDHFGSHLGELQVFLENKNSLFNVGALDWIVQGAVNYISAWASGTSPSQAVRDQLPAPGTASFPAGEAIALIGATEVPAHAITLSVPPGGLKNMLHDPNQENYDLYWYLSLLMYYNNDMRELYLNHKLWLAEQGYKAETTLDGKDPEKLYPGYSDEQLFNAMIEDAILQSGNLFSVLDNDFQLPTDIEILDVDFGETEMSNFSDPFLKIFKANENPIGVPSGSYRELDMPMAEDLRMELLSENDKSLEAFRSLIFNNDDNDAVIRVQSQRGDLDKLCPECVTHFDNVLHGYGPRYPQVQQKVLSLLNGGMTDFYENGFPVTDDIQKLYYPDEALPLYETLADEKLAICRSGMVPDHAKAFARVADEENVVIISRPVNPDATALILAGSATKEMNVKPKSANWGPQKGYLPVDQRYSKLWEIFEGQERDDQIDAYNEKSAENLKDSLTTARPLKIQLCTKSYFVYIDQNKILSTDDMNAKDEIVLIPTSDMTKVCTWDSPFDIQSAIPDCEPIGPQHELIPFEVMATPRVVEKDGMNNRFLTADYDLLMIGFFKGEDSNPYNPPQNLPFKDGVGQMTTEQEELLKLINEAVMRTGYDGGNVSHHGPENQFGKSPYIDYPLTVFMPDDTPNGIFISGIKGRVLSIAMGPPGFRDINLKRFVNDMRQQGYNLYDNPDAPGWRWTWDATSEGFLMEDSKELPDYVEELKGFKCENPSEATTICPEKPEFERNESFTDWLFDRQPSGSRSVSVAPNPVLGNAIRINIQSTNEESVQFYVLNAQGVRQMSFRQNLIQGISIMELNVSNLEPGLYTILGKDFPAMRFVRM